VHLGRKDIGFFQKAEVRSRRLRLTFSRMSFSRIILFGALFGAPFPEIQGIGNPFVGKEDEDPGLLPRFNRVASPVSNFLKVAEFSLLSIFSRSCVHRGHDRSLRSVMTVTGKNIFGSKHPLPIFQRTAKKSFPAPRSSDVPIFDLFPRIIRISLSDGF